MSKHSTVKSRSRKAIQLLRQSLGREGLLSILIITTLAIIIDILNPETYIASGILEQYVLGKLDPQEMAEVERYADQQYQLWAIVDGSPVDRGVFELDAEATGLQAVPFVQHAQAFAVTLEPRGGSASPTLDQMYVIGNT